jgi:hypothetical protein
MNIERTMDTNAVVTPNCAIASRSQMSSYKMLQNPETKKNTKYGVIRTLHFDFKSSSHWLPRSRGVLGSHLTDPTETFQSLRVSGNVIRQGLERDETTKLRILSLVDNAHPATAQFLDNAAARDGLADHR